MSDLHFGSTDDFPPFTYKVPYPKKGIFQGPKSYAEDVAEWQKGRDNAFQRYLHLKEQFQTSISQNERQEAKAEAQLQTATAKASEAAGKAAPSIAAQKESEAKASKAAAKKTATETSQQTVIASMEAEAVKGYAIDVAAAGVGGAIGLAIAGPVGGAIGAMVFGAVAETLRK